jgi:hypothetical protein
MHRRRPTGQHPPAVSIHALRFQRAMLIFGNSCKFQEKAPALREPPKNQQARSYFTPSKTKKQTKSITNTLREPLCKTTTTQGSRQTTKLSYNQRCLKICRTEHTVFLDLASFTFRQTIQAQIVLLVVYLCQQATFEVFVLHAIDATLEHRFLHALPDTFAHLGHPPQPSAAFAGFGIHVVTNNDQHAHFRKKGT